MTFRKLLCPLVLAFALLAAEGHAANQTPTKVWMAETYAEKVGVTVDEAERRLELQVEAGDIASLALETMDGSYAGLWFDLDSGRFKVAYTDETGFAKAADVIEKSSVSNHIDRVKVDNTWSELFDAKKQVAAKVKEVVSNNDLDNPSFSVSPDVERNVVLFEAPPSLLQEVRESLTKDPIESSVAVKLDETSPSFRPMPHNNCVPFHCGRPLQGGVAINNGTQFCTAGFVARSNWIPLSIWLITAGHCFDLNDTIKAVNWDTGLVRPVGPELGSHFDGWGDFAAIRIDNSNWYTNGITWSNKVAWWFVNDDHPITQVQPTYVGQFTCHTGVNTNMPPDYKCGNVLERSVTLGTPPDVLGAMTKTDACGGLGDSGGPYIVNYVVGAGIHYGGWNPGGCGPGTSSYFTEIKYIFDLLQLSLFT